MESGDMQRENVRMRDGLPVNIFLHESSAESNGCEFHWHEELELYYVRSGGVSLLSGGRQVWLHPQDVGFVNWCEPHRGSQFLDGTKHYIIQISADFLAQETVLLPGACARVSLLSLFIARSKRFPPAARSCPALTGPLDTAIREAEQKAPGYELEIKAAVLRVLAFFLRASEAIPDGIPHGRDTASMEHLKKVLVYLSDHCTEPEAVSLSALSRRFGLSAPYLCRIFKRHTNLTLTGYVNELRCARAASLLQDGIPLEAAAAKCGFHDYNYFSRLFKKVMGSPPSAYKKQNGCAAQ